MKSKILFILPSLAAGGAERVISFVSQNLNPLEFEVTLLVISSKTDDSFEIENNIDTLYLDKHRVLNSIPALYNNIHKLKPHIVFSCISHLNIVIAFLSIFFRNTKFVAREATILGARNDSKFPTKFLYKNLIKSAYPLFDKIICQSEDMKGDLQLNFKIPERKLIVINNPITNSLINHIKVKIDYEKPIKYITVGRLAEVKGHLRILKILSKISKDFRYTIIGEGPLKEDIFNAIRKYNLIEKINHVPYTRKVEEYLFDSDIFLQGSYVEGFPNAVLESCAVGTPVVSFTSPGGTKEIIENGINGFMVANEEEFIATLDRNHHWDANIIIDSVQKKFGKEKILEKYTTLFKSL